MRICYTDSFAFPLPPDHRFPLEKYALLRKRILASDFGKSHPLAIPRAATDEEILRVHDADYWRRMQTGEVSVKEMRRIGLPWSPQLIERARRSVGGTIETCLAALSDGIAVSLSGGTHHAFRNRGEGYCVFNDSAIAARALQAEGCLRRVVVIDCDAHQGNGTASIFSGDDSVFTFSIHGRNNFPFRKVPGDLDIALEDNTGDLEYQQTLAKSLERIFESFEPELAIYLAGADPYKGDRFGKLALTRQGLVARDRLVFDHCRRAGLPVAVTLAGGYAPNISDTVDIHFQTVRAALDYGQRVGIDSGGLEDRNRTNQ
jgi:acetoin utilization deacetylase AcuC-like enzyme